MGCAAHPLGRPQQQAHEQQQQAEEEGEVSSQCVLRTGPAMAK
jgi:hypothetical protein